MSFPKTNYSMILGSLHTHHVIPQRHVCMSRYTPFKNQLAEENSWQKKNKNQLMPLKFLVNLSSLYEAWGLAYTLLHSISFFVQICYYNTTALLPYFSVRFFQLLGWELGIFTQWVDFKIKAHFPFSELNSKSSLLVYC